MATAMTKQSLLVLLVLCAITSTSAQSQSRRPHIHRTLGLGKFADGPESEIDCSATSSNYEYYIERCYDTTTQWAINGRCTDGVKEEISELHKCMRPDGSRSYCHDCPDSDGGSIMKHVCGADNPNIDEVCPIAVSAMGTNCADNDDGGLAVYSYQCLSKTTSSYIRDSINCEYQEAYSSGPCMEDVDKAVFTCGKEWYYPYAEAEEDESLASAVMGGTTSYVSEKGDSHPFSVESNKYCLSCGLSIQVCASDGDAGCEELGLPESRTTLGVSPASSSADSSWGARTRYLVPLLMLVILP